MGGGHSSEINPDSIANVYRTAERKAEALLPLYDQAERGDIEVIPRQVQCTYKNIRYQIGVHIRSCIQ